VRKVKTPRTISILEKMSSAGVKFFCAVFYRLCGEAVRLNTLAVIAGALNGTAARSRGLADVTGRVVGNVPADNSLC
jgi:hypothetical protein